MRARAALAALAVAVLASCGVPEDDEPRMVPDGDVPFGLLDTSTSTSTPTVTTTVTTTVATTTTQPVTTTVS